MPVLYKTLDKRDWIYQPNFTRWRHRYRGVRESLKVNTEINQFYYDIRKLNARVDDVNAEFAENIDLIKNGGAVSGVEFQWDNDATPTIESLVLPGTDDIATRIELLRKRIEDLEAL